MTTLQKKMKAVREYYDIPKVTMSFLCGFGPNTWRRYENGDSVPTGANLKMVKQTFTPIGMKKLVRWADSMEIHEYDRIQKAVNNEVNCIEVCVTEYRRSLNNKFIDEIIDDG